MNGYFTNYESLFGKPMDLNSIDSLENPRSIVHWKTKDNLENQGYLEFQWHIPLENQWGWKNRF